MVFGPKEGPIPDSVSSAYLRNKPYLIPIDNGCLTSSLEIDLGLEAG